MRGRNQLVESGRALAPAFVDAVVFAALLSTGWAWQQAHLLSFAAGLLTLGLADPTTRRGARLLRGVCVAVVILAVRGGVLATLVRLGLGAAPYLVLAAVPTWPLLAFGRRGLSTAWNVDGTGGDSAVLRLAMTFTAISLLLRIVYLFPIELMHEEAYYWLYAQHLDWAYSDHPPFVGAMIWAGIRLAGETELGVRLLAPLFWVGGAAFVFALAHRSFDRVVAWVAVALFACLPFLFFAGFVAFPDTPLIFCWAGSVYFLHRMLVDDAKHAWLGVGLFLGLGLLAKFTIGLLGLAAVLFAAAHPRTRRLFTRWQPYAAIAVTVALFTPVLLWNADHEWASFARQSTTRLATGFKFKLPVLLLFVGVHLLPIGVIGTWQTLKAWWRGRTADAAERHDGVHRARELAVWLMLVPLVAFVLASLFRNTKFNWTAPLWIPVLPFIAAGLLRPVASGAASMGRRLEKHSARLALGVLVVYALGLYHLGLGIPGVPYTPGLGGVGWRGAGARLEQAANERRRPDGTRPLVVGIDGDTTPSWISFYRGLAAGPVGHEAAVAETVGGHLFCEPCGMFEQWFPIPDPPIEQDLLLVVSNQAWALRRQRIGPWIQREDEIFEIDLAKNGRPAGVLYARWVYGYRGP